MDPKDLTDLPKVEPYVQARNTYNPASYPANKKITAEEWNSLLLSSFAQGNRQEYHLDLLINGLLNTLTNRSNDHTTILQVQGEQIKEVSGSTSEFDQRITDNRTDINQQRNEIDAITKDYVRRQDNPTPLLDSIDFDVTIGDQFIKQTTAVDIRTGQPVAYPHKVVIGAGPSWGKARLFTPSESETLEDLESWRESLTGDSPNFIVDFSKRPWGPYIAPSDIPTDPNYISHQDLQDYLWTIWTDQLLGDRNNVRDQVTMTQENVTHDNPSAIPPIHEIGPLSFRYYLNTDTWYMIRSVSFTTAGNRLYDFSNPDNPILIEPGWRGIVMGSNWPYEIFVDTQGRMRVNGLEDFIINIINDVQNKRNRIIDPNQVYITDVSGSDSKLPFDITAVEDTVPIRGAGGTIKAGRAIVGTDVVNRTVLEEELDRVPQIITITQSQYDALIEPDENTFYAVSETLPGRLDTVDGQRIDLVQSDIILLNNINNSESSIMFANGTITKNNIRRIQTFSLILPNNIGDNFCANMPSLTSIDADWTPVQTIGDNFLLECTAFNRSLLMPNITIIGHNFLANNIAFNQQLVLFNKLTTIGNNFLFNCESFDRAIVFPMIQTIGNNFMAGCTTYNQTITITTVTSIGTNFLSNCLFFNQLLNMPFITQLHDSFLSGANSFNQPLSLSSITNIGNNFLDGAGAYNQRIDLSNNLTAVGTNFLRNCNNMMSILNIGTLTANIFTTGDSLTTININAALNTQGIPIIGTNVAAFLIRFPNSTGLPFRYIFNGNNTIQTTTGTVINLIQSDIVLLNNTAPATDTITFNAGQTVLKNTIRSISIMSLTMPAIIGNNFCQNMTSLTRIDAIWTPVIQIGDSFLSGCIAYSQPFTIPNGLLSIGTSFMYNCNLMMSLNIGNNAANIFAFSNTTLATTTNTAPMYMRGVLIIAETPAIRAAFLVRFPNQTSTPFRRLI